MSEISIPREVPRYSSCEKKLIAVELNASSGISSAKTAQRTHRRLQTSRHVLNNFIDPVKLRALDEETLPREGYVAYVGRLSHEKGVDTLLQVARETPSITLKLAGNGPLRLSLTAQYGSLPNVEFVGQLEAAQVANFVSRAACMVVPSEWYENNPLTIIEAQCAGTPVVGSNMGGIPELVAPGNGIIFEAGDRTALTEALDRALHTDWDYAGIRARGRERFSADLHLARLLKLYFPDVS